jgi:flap endonuclease-1
VAQVLILIHIFSEDRVRKGAEKLAKAVNAKQQGRLDGFFTVQPKTKEKDTKTGKGKGAKDDPKPKGTKRKVRSSISSMTLP